MPLVRRVFGALPASPDPNRNDYCGRSEFSRDPGADQGVWLNLSNMDIVGLPLTVRGMSAEGKPSSLGYRKSVDEITDEIEDRALPSVPAVVKDCGCGRTKIVAPNSQFRFYRRHDGYLSALTAAGVYLTISADTPRGGAAKTFTGSFARGTYQSLLDADPILTLGCDSDTFDIARASSHGVPLPQ